MIDLQALSAPILMGLFFVSVCLCLPSAHLGFLLGFKLGTAYGFLATMILLGFSLIASRFIFFRFNKILTRIQFGLWEKKFSTNIADSDLLVFSSRLNPLIPFPVGTYFFLAIRYPFRRLVLISLLGVAPANFLTVWLGSGTEAVLINTGFHQQVVEVCVGLSIVMFAVAVFRMVLK